MDLKGVPDISRTQNEPENGRVVDDSQAGLRIEAIDERSVRSGTGL